MLANTGKRIADIPELARISDVKLSKNKASSQIDKINFKYNLVVPIIEAIVCVSKEKFQEFKRGIQKKATSRKLTPEDRDRVALRFNKASTIKDRTAKSFTRGVKDLNQRGRKIKEDHKSSPKAESKDDSENLDSDKLSVKSLNLSSFMKYQSTKPQMPGFNA